MTDERKPSRIRRWLVGGAWASSALTLLLAGAAFWLLATASGAQFVLDRAVALAGGSLGTVEGRLVGPLAVDAIEVSTPTLRLRAKQVALDWSPSRLLGGEVRIERLQRRVDRDRDGAVAGAGPRARHARAARPALRRTRGRGPAARRPARAGRGRRRDCAKCRCKSRLATRRGSSVARRPPRPSGGRSSPARSAPPRHSRSSSRASSRERAATAPTGPRWRLRERSRRSTRRSTRAKAGSPARRARRSSRSPPCPSGASRRSSRDWTFPRSPPCRGTDLAVEADLAPRDGAILAGPVRIANAGAGPLDKGRLPVASATAHLAINADRFEATKVAAAFAGGGSAAGEVRWAGGKLDAKLVVKEADLRSWHSQLRATKLSGDISAVATGEAQSFDVALVDPRFEIRGDAKIAQGVLTVGRARLSRGAAFAEASGTLALAGALANSGPKGASSGSTRRRSPRCRRAS